MNTLYKTLSLYLPKKQNSKLKRACLYAYNGNNLINLYSYNSYSKIIEYSYELKEYNLNHTRFMLVNTFIKEGYKIVNEPKYLDKIYSSLIIDELPF